MGKFSGKIGYAIQVERSPGIWVDSITEVDHVGDVLQNNVSRWQNSDNLNNNLMLDNKISLVATPFLNENSGYIRYLILNGIKWRVTKVEFVYPRVILSLGEIYVTAIE